MKTIRRNLIKGKDTFYVVTRDNRRIEDINYKIKHEAEDRAYSLEYLLKKGWDPKSSVAVVVTSLPHKIY